MFEIAKTLNKHKREIKTVQTYVRIKSTKIELLKNNNKKE